MNGREKSSGFTIVELLIVIVVIGILAAITIVAFNGVQSKARTSAMQSTLSQFAKKMETLKLSSGAETYPTDLSASNVLIPSGYTYTTTATGTGYCFAGVDNDIAYYVTNSSSAPKKGTCVTVDGLVGWWPLNGNVSDVSGNNAESVAINVTPTNGQNGDANGAYSFNGTNSQITCGTSSILAPTAAVTVSAWVYLNANATDITGFVNYGGGGYWLYGSNSGVPLFYVSNSNVTTSSALSMNQWYFLTGTFKPGERKIYVNGNVVGSDAASGISSITNYSTEMCRIGTIKAITNRFLNGKMDDVRVYNRVLSASEIQALYTAGAQ